MGTSKGLAGAVLAFFVASGACSRATPRDDAPMPAMAALSKLRGLEWVGSGVAPHVREARFSVPASDARPALEGALDRSSVRLDAGDDAWIDVEYVTPAPARVERGLVAWSHHDESMVWAWSEHAVEQLHVLGRDTELAVELHTGPAIRTLSVERDRVIARDAEGRAVLQTADAWIEDARGVRRPVHPVLHGTLPDVRLSLGWDHEDLVPPLVVDPAWTKIAAMSRPRRGPCVASLVDGRVLVVGGETEGTGGSWELYDPTANTWSGGTGLPSFDPQSRSARLASGKVLVTGGYALADATLFDPSTKTWTTVGSMGTPRADAVMVALSDGRALIVGGGPGSSITPNSTAEIFSPATNKFTAVAPMSAARVNGTGHLLSSGKVMIEGGYASASTALSTTEIYDPATNTWTAGPTMKATHVQSTGITLGDGRPVVIGQYTGIEVFDGTNWTLASGPAPASLLGAAPFGTTRALVMANTACVGCASVPPVVLDGTSILPADPSIVAHRNWPAVAPLPGGKVLVAGGDGTDGPLSFAEVFAPLGVGSACSGTGTCAVGLTCVDSVCCSSSSCAANETCAGAASKGTCKPKNGQACTTNAACASGICVDSVCCDRACNGKCEACDGAGLVGTCAPIAGKPHGTRTACVATSTACGLACDGVDPSACHYASKTTPCSKDACSAGVETHARLCDGSGACTDVAKACGAFACGALACDTSCTTASDCAAGFTCKSSVCVPTLGLGTSCGVGADCTTGFCVDGVCCGAAACASGSVCNLAGKAGTCQKTFGATCASDAECGVGTCVDGVCCDTACTGACEACDVPGKEGTCSAVSGAPHGTRAMCAAGDGPCAARTCDGKDRTTCAGWLKGHETTCADAKCEAGAFIAASRCDGAGACLAPTKTSCSPFACAKDGCLAVCKSDTDCQTGFQCVSARCVDATARCTDDHLSSRASDGRVASCAPYVCGSAGTCQSSCTSSDECAPGFACAAGACVPPVTETSGNDASGGCSYGATRPASGAVVLAFVIALFVLRRRRALWASFALVASCTSQDRGAPLPQTEGPAMREKDWSTVGVMPVSVIHPVVVAQPDGSALFFGVTDGTACCKDVLRFDPTTKNVSKVGSQLTPRVVPLAARVGSGKVLVAGGNGSAGATLSTTELYDPSTNTATAGPTMAVGRWNSVAIPLAGGDVLFVGGAYPGTSIAERYVASTGTFQTSTAPIAPVVATGVQLASGKVLVIPIDTSSPNANALYDPSTNTWSSAGPLLGWPRQDAHLVKLASGKVLVVGASTAWPYSALAELYDPTSNTFTNAAPIPARVYAPIVGLLPSGRVLVAGGQGYSSFRKETLVYDPAADAWRSASPLANEYNTPGGATLSDGRVLIAGDTHVELFTEGAVGATCTQAADCKNLQCVDGVCCGTASCPAGSTCAPGGTCKLAKGIACATDAACGTGHCVDGVCCDTACTEQCGACNVAGKVGTCSAVLGSPRGSRAACTGAGLGTECGASCNGVVTTSCTFAPSGTACGADACTAGIETKKSTCNGSGGCADTSLGCAPYLCGDTACKTSCASSTDCAPGAFCRASACVPIEGLGEACTADGECSSGHCVDGVCCATGSCGAGQVCNDPTRKGTCVKSRGTACSVSAECATGHCVDGVCCDAACDGVCEACDVSGKAGTCTPVDGTPHGARPACASSDEICAARTCLGSKDTKTCAGFVAAASTTCAPSKCDASTFVAASTCDGAGACVAPASASCAPYACNAAGCLTACAIDLDCAVGWVCRKSVCMREGTSCTADLAASIGKDGKATPCAPYKCTTDGTCASTCATSDDCGSGAICDTATKTCAAPPAEDSGGCAMSRPGASSTMALFAVLASCAAVRRRRQRVASKR